MVWTTDIDEILRNKGAFWRTDSEILCLGRDGEVEGGGGGLKEVSGLKEKCSLKIRACFLIRWITICNCLIDFRKFFFFPSLEQFIPDRCCTPTLVAGSVAKL